MIRYSQQVSPISYIILNCFAMEPHRARNKACAFLMYYCIK